MRVRFGDFVVDDESRQLRRGGRTVHLSPKAFDLLAILIRERPKALSKTELHASLWPKVFVSDGSLAMLVSEVRRAVGERAGASRVIRTLHRHGYAFQADATTIDDGAQSLGYWIVTGDRQIALASGDNTVGRDPKARVWLDSPSVSRRHARISVGEGHVTVEDLHSKNGTFVSDRRLHGIASIDDGALLRFGSVGVTFRAWAAEPTRTEGDEEPPG